MELAQGTLVADRFRLEHELGRGGMGAVWRAHHVGLNMPCAIKFILGEAAAMPEIRGRFEQEAQAAAQLKSPHVVQILDHGVWGDAPYIAMELLEGEDLEKRLERRGRLELREIAGIVAQVARALGKAHVAGLVHRDLKPANVFLCRDDDGEVVKILDFGIAKQTQSGLSGSKTKTGAMLGTPYYMSPEQARGVRSVDHRSDLWSLAVIVYQCVTGRLPFESDALGDLLVRIMFNPLPVPSQIAPLPAGFDAWWARAAAREPEARFQNAREMAEALAMVAGVSFGAGEPYSMAAPPRSPAAAMTASPAMPTMLTWPSAAAGGGTLGGAVVPARRQGVWIALTVSGLVLAAVAFVAFVAMRGGAATRAAAATEVASASTSTASATTPPAGPIVTPSAAAIASSAAPPDTAAPIASARATTSPAPSSPGAQKPSPIKKPPSGPTKPRYDDGI